METAHNVINLCTLFDIGIGVTCASNAVHKVPVVSSSVQRFPVLQIAVSEVPAQTRRHDDLPLLHAERRGACVHF